ncbi:hypothetical protein QJS66_22965 [Kocuria rhizophila]|nr:hypothetical protein QJS66_22965 [Kocuria rhizophila]
MRPAGAHQPCRGTEGRQHQEATRGPWWTAVSSSGSTPPRPSPDCEGPAVVVFDFEMTEDMLLDSATRTLGSPTPTRWRPRCSTGWAPGLTSPIPPCAPSWLNDGAPTRHSFTPRAAAGLARAGRELQQRRAAATHGGRVRAGARRSGIHGHVARRAQRRARPCLPRSWVLLCSVDADARGKRNEARPGSSKHDGASRPPHPAPHSNRDGPHTILGTSPPRTSQTPRAAETLNYLSTPVIGRDDT